MVISGGNRVRRSTAKIAVTAIATAAVAVAAPVGTSSAEVSPSATSLAAAIADAWATGVCPRSAAESVDLVRQVKDASLGEAAMVQRLHDLSDSLAREAGFDGFDEAWGRVALASAPDAAAERERILRMARCFHSHDIHAAVLADVVVPVLVDALGSGARAADAAVSLLVDERVIDAFVVATVSDQPDSVPAELPDEPDAATDAVGPVLGATDGIELAKSRGCNYGGYDLGDKRRSRSQEVTAYNTVGRRNFSEYNRIDFTYNPARYCTKFGSASRNYEIHSCLQPVACWVFDGYVYDEEGHYYFDDYVQGGWKSRQKGHFVLEVLTWWFGSIKTQHHSMYNNLYGHFDGGVSPFHGGYPAEYTRCEPGCSG